MDFEISCALLCGLEPWIIENEKPKKPMDLIARRYWQKLIQQSIPRYAEYRYEIKTFSANALQVYITYGVCYSLFLPLLVYFGV